MTDPRDEENARALAITVLKWLSLDPEPGGQSVGKAWRGLVALALEASRAAGRAERDGEVRFFETCGIIELAIRNPNVDSYMREWESRALAAEQEVERLKATCESWSKDFNSIAKKLDSAEIALGIADAHANVQTARIEAAEAKCAELEKDLAHIQTSTIPAIQHEHAQEVAQARRAGIEEAAKVAQGVSDETQAILRSIPRDKRSPGVRRHPEYIRTTHGAKVANDIALAIRALLPSEPSSGEISLDYSEALRIVETQLEESPCKEQHEGTFAFIAAQLGRER
jgi:hypothetical protein